MSTGRPRLFIAGLFCETHTFVEGSVGVADFTWLRGAEMLAAKGDSSPLGGALAEAERLGCEILPLVDGRMGATPMVQDAVLEHFWRELLMQAEAIEPADGMLLILHGAMVTPSFPDVEGEVMRRVRAVPQWAALPVGIVLDLHGNISAGMTAAAQVVCGYRENPHIDGKQTAIRAMGLLHRVMTGAASLRTAFASVPVIWPPPGTGTASAPMATLCAMARAAEREVPGLHDVTVMGGFAFADTPDTRVSFLAVHDADAAPQAEALLDRLVGQAWQDRELGRPTGLPPDEVLQAFLKEQPAPAGPLILAECSDNIGGGAPGDGTGVLRSLLALGIDRSAVALCDPVSLTRLAGLDPGARATLELGGRGSRYDAGPVTLEVTLLRRGEGRFELEDKQSHLASAYGDFFDMGPCAVVEAQGITILLTTHPVPPMDLGQWTSQGLSPAKFRVIGVKAAVAHRRAYDPIAWKNVLVETPGPCPNDLRTLPYCQVRRPVWPLDELASPL